MKMRFPMTILAINYPKYEPRMKLLKIGPARKRFSRLENNKKRTAQED